MAICDSFKVDYTEMSKVIILEIGFLHAGGGEGEHELPMITVVILLMLLLLLLLYCCKLLLSSYYNISLRIRSESIFSLVLYDCTAPQEVPNFLPKV